MKSLLIGIITHWRGKDNYGQILQVFALQNVLKNMGHNVYLIKYISSGPDQRSKTEKILRILSVFNPYKLIIYWRERKKKYLLSKEWKEHPRNFENFFDHYINTTDILYTIDTLKKNPPLADVLICGSDQVWNKLESSYFLNFGPQNILRIAYAASFGAASYSKLQIKRLYHLLQPINHIMVREPEGIEICRKAGRTDAQCSPDPTLLIQVTEYLRIAKLPNQTKKYLLLYLLGNRHDININLIYEFAKKENLEIIYIASQGQVDKYPKVYPSIEEWLGYICQAEYVITNSFHGTVFSILFNRYFLTIPLIGHSAKMNSRITTLFKTYNMENRFFDNNIDNIKIPINYNRINILLKNQRNNALNLLNNILNKKNNA